MPNHVYHTIEFTSPLTDKQRAILNKIVANKKGLCGHYKPMPKALVNTTSPSRILSETEYQKWLTEDKSADQFPNYYITQQMSDDLISKYGTDNWYNWANTHWGTKWGCYENEFEYDVLRFTTAWCPMDYAIIEKFAEQFPDFIWHWEEDQGFGEVHTFVKGESEDVQSYDRPDWDDVATFHDGRWERELVYLKNGIAETPCTEARHDGFYLDRNFDEYLGYELPESILNKLSAENVNEDYQHILNTINK